MTLGPMDLPPKVDDAIGVTLSEQKFPTLQVVVKSLKAKYVKDAGKCLCQRHFLSLKGAAN